MKRAVPIVLALVICAPLGADDASRIEAARAVMARARFCALITVGDDGQPQARTMDPAPPDARMVVWLATNPATRKVIQIKRNPRVTLYYFDEKSPAYVTLIGTAKLITDAAAKQQHWLQKWDQFYPGGPATAVLIEVTPRRLEVVDPAHGVVGDPKSWLPPSVDFSPAHGASRPLPRPPR